jgi:hypothetical protein
MHNEFGGVGRVRLLLRVRDLAEGLWNFLAHDRGVSWARQPGGGTTRHIGCGPVGRRSP